MKFIKKRGTNKIALICETKERKGITQHSYVFKIIAINCKLILKEAHFSQK